MEDIKALCKRTVVVNHGSKIYDGETQELFNRYQKNKKIIVTFDEQDTDITLKTPNAVLLENTLHKKIYNVSKRSAKDLLAELMEYDPKDIAVEEEEIGVIVERIYQEGCACLA